MHFLLSQSPPSLEITPPPCTLIITSKNKNCIKPLTHIFIFLKKNSHQFGDHFLFKIYLINSQAINAITPSTATPFKNVLSIFKSDFGGLPATLPVVPLT